MNRELVLLVGDIGLLIGFIFVLLFSFRFLTVSQWRENKTGRALASFMSVIGAILGFVTIVAFVGDFPGRIFVRLALYWWFAASSVYFFVRLLNAQKRGNGVGSAQLPDQQKGPSDG